MDENLKKRVIFVIVFFMICVITLLSIVIMKKTQENKKREESEVIRMFQKEVYVEVFLEQSEEDLEKVENQLKKLEHIESVQLHSKEEVLQEMSEKLNDDLLDGFYGENNIFPNSFLLKIEIKSIEDMNEDYFDRIEESIKKIDGVKRISSNFKTLTTIYQKKGMDGLEEYLKIMQIIKEQDMDLEKHPDAKKLLTD